MPVCLPSSSSLLQRLARWRRRKRWLVAPWLLSAALACASPVAARVPVMPQASVEPPVRGLLVRLRDAPAHDARSRAGIAAAPTAAGRDAARRWQAVAARTRLALLPGLRVQPVGRASWRVMFEGAADARTVRQWARRLAAEPDVAWAVPNERERPLQAQWPQPDDPQFGGAAGQWWLQVAGGANDNAIDARLRGVPGFQRAWARGTGSDATVVAVLDTGISAHPDLPADRLLPGFDMVSDWDAVRGLGNANDGDGRDADPADPGDWVDAADVALDPARYQGCPLQPSDWHGTAVAGFIAAATDNGVGVAGATWAGRVLPVRVAGKCGAEVADIVDGMRWAAGLPACQAFAAGGCSRWAPLNPHPARIVNISFGGTAACNAEYQDAIDELHALGVVVVAAAGNGHASPTRPASCRGVVGVAALNRDGFKAVYSNFGSAVKIATVGGDDGEGRWGPWLADGGLLSLANDGATSPGQATTGRHVGTSFSAPLVAATAALMLAADPTLSADELMAGLAASARPHVTSPTLPNCSAVDPGRCLCTTATCGAGILDATEAVAFAQAHAARQAYAPPRWPVEVIANTEVSQAVATGPDIVQPGVDGAGPAGSGGGAASLGDALALLLCSAAWVSRWRSRPACVRSPLRSRRVAALPRDEAQP